MRLKGVLLLLIGALLSSNCLAHPHNWITLTTDLILDKQGRLTELRQRWEFDIYYSMMTMADIANEHGAVQPGLKSYGTKMIQNLRNYNYFSSLQREGKDIELTTPKEYELRTKEVNGKTVLELGMVFKWKDPLAIEAQTLRWRVFDPTFYIDMAHRETANVVIHAANATECSKRIELPDPSEELVEYAASLDKNQRDSQGLGEDFAETIIIYCI